jgi:hypothetical protein
MLRLGVLGIILSIVVLTLVPTLPVSAEFDAKWYLYDTTTIGTVYNHGGPWPMYEMVRSIPPTVSGSMTVAPGDSCVWRADKSTPLPAPFGTGDWSAKLTIGGTLPPEEELEVYLGYIQGNLFTQTGTGTANRSGNSMIYMINIEIDGGGSFTVPAGAYLALEVRNASSSSFDVLTYDTHGWLKPPGEPTYPTPELSTIILMSSGLVALGGFFWFKRQRRASTGKAS